MWFLIAENNLDVKYGILGGKAYVVGRRDCDILVTGDAAVSRKHAELSVSHTEANLTNTARLPILRLTDLSKFGTWVNKQRVEGDKILKDGDVVYFGSQISSFLVVYEPLVVTSSCLEPAGKRSLRKTLCTLGGHMVNEWREDCALLIMNRINVTIKVICAMVSLKPIVSPAYLEDYVKHLQGVGTKPDPTAFIPELAETQVDPSEVSFSSDNRRRTIFQGKTFIFFSSKQLKKMNLAIELGGGLPMLMENKIDKQLLLAEDTVVMTCPETDITKDNKTLVASATSLLNKDGKRLIPDSDIGYAVLYCSTDKYCNPDQKTGKELSHLPSQTLSQADPFAESTQTQSRRGTQKHASQVQTGATWSQTQGKCETDIQGETETLNMATVKEEPLSGKGPPKGRKRQRVEDSLEEEVAASTPKLKKVKEEPISPASKTVSQSKTSTKQTSEPFWDSDDNTDIVDSRPTRLSRRKLSPTPSSSKSKTVSPSRDIVSMDNKQKHSKSRSRSPKNSTREQTGTKSRSRSPAEPKHSTIEQTVTKSRSRSPADSKKSDKRPRETRSSSKSPVKFKDSTSVPLQTRSRSPAGKRSPDKTKSVSPQRSPRMSPHGIKEEEEDVPELLPGQRSRSSPSRGLGDGFDEDEDFDSKPDVSENVTVPKGFLTTRKPIQNQVKKNTDYEEDAELPKACIQVEFKSLLVKRPQPTAEKDQHSCPEGYTKWKGKIIRNFKKFKKSNHLGSQALPNIIGGSALEVHQAERSKEMDEWFRDAVQAESQHANEDRRAKDLFDYEPSTKRRGR